MNENEAHNKDSNVDSGQEFCKDPNKDNFDEDEFNTESFHRDLVENEFQIESSNRYLDERISYVTIRRG